MAIVKKLISLDPSVALELESVSKALHITQKELIEKALDFYFDHTDSVIAQKISHDIASDKESVRDADEVFAELGI